MSRFGIKLVWAGWHDEDVIGFSPKAYEQWKYDVQPGTRMLIYETDMPKDGKVRGIKGIVGEVEVIDGFGKSGNLASPTQEDDIPVRVKILHPRDSMPVIPLKQVRTILAEPTFARVGQSWRPIFETVYKDLLKVWEQAE